MTSSGPMRPKGYVIEYARPMWVAVPWTLRPTTRRVASCAAARPAVVVKPPQKSPAAVPFNGLPGTVTAIAAPRMITTTERILRRSPSARSDEIKLGPTCNPIAYMNKTRGEIAQGPRTAGSMVNPICPKRSDEKRTPATPNRTPRTRIAPKSRPMVAARARIPIPAPTELSTSSLLTQFAADENIHVLQK